MDTSRSRKLTLELRVLDLVEPWTNFWRCKCIICNIWIVFDCIVYVHAYISILTLSQKYLIFLRNARKLLDFYRSSMPRSWQIPWIWPRDRASPGPARTASACPLPRHRVPRPSILHGNWDRSSDSPGDWKPERQAAAQQTSGIVRHVILRLLQSLDLIHSFVRSSCTHSLISLILFISTYLNTFSVIFSQRHVACRWSWWTRHLDVPNQGHQPGEILLVLEVVIKLPLLISFFIFMLTYRHLLFTLFILILNGSIVKHFRI